MSSSGSVTDLDKILTQYLGAGHQVTLLGRTWTINPDLPTRLALQWETAAATDSQDPDTMTEKALAKWRKRNEIAQIAAIDMVYGPGWRMTIYWLVVAARGLGSCFIGRRWRGTTAGTLRRKYTLCSLLSWVLRLTRLTRPRGRSNRREKARGRSEPARVVRFDRERL